MIASVIGSWMRDDIPEELTNAMNETNKRYRFEDWKASADNIFQNIMNERIKELEETKIIAKNSNSNE